MLGLVCVCILLLGEAVARRRFREALLAVPGRRFREGLTVRIGEVPSRLRCDAVEGRLLICVCCAQTSSLKSQSLHLES